MGVHERPQPHAGSKYRGVSPLFPGICSWDPSILGHVQGRKEDQASSCGVWVSIFVWPKTLLSHFGS